MNALAQLVAEPDGAGGARITTLRSEAPLLLRPTPTGLHLLGGAAGPLGGDRLRLEVEVTAGASLTVRSVAASIALPGPTGATSTLDVEVSVGRGACLRWLPEPLVAAAGCRHRITLRLAVDRGATVVWREELVLGRHGEPGGSVVSRMAIDVAHRPLLRQSIALGPDHAAWSSPAVGAGARATGSVVVVGPTWAEAPPPTVLGGGRGALLPLAGPGVQVAGLADDARALRALLDEGLDLLLDGPR